MIVQIIYTSGPAISVYLALRGHIPTGIVVNDDGSIQYPTDQVPPVPEGWEAVAPGLFKPIWPDCAYRALRGHVYGDGLRLECDCHHGKVRTMEWEGLTVAKCQGC